MTTPAIELRDVYKEYKSVRTVDLKHLTVRKGEIYGFLGPNGAGKSTTMKMILSLVKPTSGSIYVMGKPISRRSYLSQIGSMIEEPSYYPNLTAYENLHVFQQMLGFNKEHIWPTLERVGLADLKNKNKLVRDYSLGMKQRLALAFALVKKPTILLLDEPTNGLDPAGIHEIRELILSLAHSQGLTVFISSHILSEIEHVADRVGIIHKGHLVYEGEVDAIKSNTWVEIGGRFICEKVVTQLRTIEVYPRDISTRRIVLDSLSDDNIAAVVKTLVNAQADIYAVERKTETLEDIFLNLTKEM
ncbi:ABC transporter ATP-binding protein [Alloscardovia omnicolens]|uniref:ABC transporter ATP-binding protein n=1 Tax=Alloscardovia omnicolens TaxID=419015 RepID=UPI0028E2DA3A|nr:ABC transporter ATP-binding protein [Alloscardovia omnicolens]